MPKVCKQPTTPPKIFHGLVTTSQQMEEFFEIARRVARTDAAVLIRGETGTGKELIAKALHDMSSRRNASFRALNCATLTPELLASELFGHVKGAFTGAIRDRKGLFALSDGGTLFLDEIAELPLDIQARLLRVLQEQTFVPVGGTEPVSVNVRVLSATHSSLRSLVEEKKFRADLMYRIRVVPLFLPPLAERDGDICALTWHFINKFNAIYDRQITGIDQNVANALDNYPWPGNVRELQNVVEFAFAVGKGETWTFDEIPPELRGEPPPQISRDTSQMTEQDLERQRLLDALRQAGGKRSVAADLLDISRTTLWRKLREHGIA